MTDAQRQELNAARARFYAQPMSPAAGSESLDTMERDAQQRGILLDRIKSMKAALWTPAEVAIVVQGWPADWQRLVAGRF